MEGRGPRGLEEGRGLVSRHEMGPTSTASHPSTDPTERAARDAVRGHQRARKKRLEDGFLLSGRGAFGHPGRHRAVWPGAVPRPVVVTTVPDRPPGRVRAGGRAAAVRRSRARELASGPPSGQRQHRPRIAEVEPDVVVVLRVWGAALIQGTRCSRTSRVLTFHPSAALPRLGAGRRPDRAGPSWPATKAKNG